MKKISTLLLSLLAGLFSLVTLSSCEWWTEDDEIVYDIQGTWGGEMYFASYYDGNLYYSNYTKLEFVKQGYNRGTGYWIDYYSQAPWDYVANHFEWRVDFGVIYIHLLEDNYNIEIRDFVLNDDVFRGYVFYEGEQRHFDLYHTSSPNWGGYDYGWGYDGGYGWGNGWGYYSNRRELTTDSVAGNKQPAERPKRVLLPAEK